MTLHEIRTQIWLASGQSKDVIDRAKDAIEFNEELVTVGQFKDHPKQIKEWERLLDYILK